MTNSRQSQTIPNDTEAEQAVLGSIIEENDKIIKACKWIDCDSFFMISHQKIFKSMLDLDLENKPIDEVTLGDKLKSKSELEEIGGYAYLAELAECSPSSGNIEAYSAIIKEHSIARKAIEVLTEGGQKARDPEQNINNLLEDLNQRLINITVSNERRSSKINNVLKECFDIVEERSKNEDPITGIPSGFVDLDNVTSGLQDTDLIIIAARPAMGKSSFALNIALNAARDTRKKGLILIFSVEMPRHQLGFRLIALDAKINTKKFLNGNFDDDDWDKMHMSGGDISSLPIIIDDTPNISISNLLATSRYYNQVEKDGVSMIMVDYLQLMQGDKNLSREQQVSEITRSLKALAKEMGIPVVALSQLNRAVEKRTERRPMLSDLRESGSIEQDSDVIMFIYRDEVYNAESPDRGVAEIDIAKHRNGPTALIKLSFIDKYTKFGNLARVEYGV